MLLILYTKGLKQNIFPWGNEFLVDGELACNIFLRAKNLKDFSKLRDLKDNF